MLNLDIKIHTSSNGNLYFADPKLYFTDDIRSLTNIEFCIIEVGSTPYIIPCYKDNEYGNSAVKLKPKQIFADCYCECCFGKIRKRKEDKNNFVKPRCLECEKNSFRERSRYNTYYCYKNRIDFLG